MADIITTRIFTDGEKGITATKMNDIVGSSIIQPAFYSAKSTASTADPADTLLLLKAAGSYAQIPFSAVTASVAGQLPSADPEIWSVRLRSYSSIVNPNFEVDQRNCGNAVAMGAGTFLVDRWIGGGVGTWSANCQQLQSHVMVPGTSFYITNRFLRFALTTAQSSLGANDYAQIFTNIEGSMLRQLIGDVHSISLLVRSSVADLKFGLNIADNTTTHVLSKLCALGASNTWTLITLPNLPIWMGAGTWSTTPGAVGYWLGINLAAGSSRTVSTNDVWLASTAWGAVGQSNFVANAGATFDIAFVQDEPGPVCSTLMDKPFDQNYNECQRYFQKSYLNSNLVGAAEELGACRLVVPASQYPVGTIRFPCRMAKAPGITGYGTAGGGSGNVYDNNAATNRAIISAYGVGETGFGGFGTSTVNASATTYTFHYTADIGW